jgi:two-component system sensor histidine kinase KdpD
MLKMNDNERPSPDDLLASIQRNEKAEGRGRLKIFFGMSAGVGKTYSMLEAAHSLRKKGVDVVAGIVETHGRKETEALLEGIPVIPRITIEYKNINLQDLDLDEILRRKPSIVLIDELAHTNSPGMRHKKRYQDVLELLDNGINVYTTLNVQHVESLVDTVQQISGITVRETVPDSVLDIADEIELVDISPEELLQRFSEGKVYTPERSAAAVENFFQKGNLTALREIALRKTAQRVDLQLKDYMEEHRISGPWKTVERLMVAIGPSPYSEQLIRWTRRIASTMEAPWIAVYVQTADPLTVEAEKRLKKNIELAQELGATMVTTSDNDVVKALIRTARRNNVTQIVVGKSMTSRFKDFFHGGSLVSRLIAESGSIDIYVVQGEIKSLKKKFSLPAPIISSPLNLYLASCAAVVITSLICYLAQSVIDYRSVGMFLLFMISILSLFAGRGPVLVAAVLAAVIWDLVFIPPRFTFVIKHTSDILLLFLFIIIAVVTGNLTSRIRLQQRMVRRREEQSVTLSKLVSDLSSAETIDDIANVAVMRIKTDYNIPVICYFAEPGTDLPEKPHIASTFHPDSDKEWSVAEWVFKNKCPAGHDSDTLPFADAYYYPLLSHGNCFGVIGVVAKNDRLLTFEKEAPLRMIINQIALALERLHLRSDRLNKTLLRSISHELRTPISAITAAASGLTDSNVQSNHQTTAILLNDINTAAKRLNRVVENFLDATRIESGALHIKMEWCDITDLFNSVQNELKSELAGRIVKIDIQENMPFVQIDTVLVEQALENLVINAAQYTPENTSIYLKAHYDEHNLILCVEDEGPGIPPESVSRIFEKFYRVPGSMAGGTGLGLSIVKGIIEYLGGSVCVKNRTEGGAQFIIRLRLVSRPFPSTGM